MIAEIILNGFLLTFLFWLVVSLVHDLYVFWIEHKTRV